MIQNVRKYVCEKNVIKPQQKATTEGRFFRGKIICGNAISYRKIICKTYESVVYGYADLYVQHQACEYTKCNFIAARIVDASGELRLTKSILITN